MFEHIFNTFAAATTIDIITSVIDIIVVWYLVYLILKMLRGTKAMQVLFGLVLISVLYWVSTPEIFDLSTLNWTLDKFITYFVVIVVIIFQEDIRRGLSEFGKPGSLNTSSGKNQLGASPIEEIIKAASMLSERRIGALIAMEMEASLDSYMVEGIPIDANVTKELLVSLFIPFKANPTHDGATIIRDNRIYSAGCFLPLSSNDKIDKSLGTRHRAALGLSESTDAVVLVVSEETGTISIAHKEQLIRRLSTEDLRELLYKLFNDDVKQKNKSFSVFRKFFSNR